MTHEHGAGHVKPIQDVGERPRHPFLLERLPRATEPPEARQVDRVHVARAGEFVVQPDEVAMRHSDPVDQDNGQGGVPVRYPGARRER